MATSLVMRVRPTQTAPEVTPTHSRLQIRPQQPQGQMQGQVPNQQPQGQQAQGQQAQAQVPQRQAGIPDATSYKRMQQKEHIYKIADTYIGSDQQNTRETLLLDLGSMRIFPANIVFPQGCERLGLELISNAADNVDRSIRLGMDPGRIDIVMDRKTLSIRNGGVPIPVQMHPDEGVWVPEMIFGILLTSSNYDTGIDRTGNGRNGFGAKLCNVFSWRFRVTVRDGLRGLLYVQEWTQHMDVRGEPVITQFQADGQSFVEVSYDMDFPRFGYMDVDPGNPNATYMDNNGQQQHRGYPDEAIALFARHAADQAFTCKVPVSFNGIELKTQTVEKYGEMLFGADIMKRSVVYCEWPPGTETVSRRNGSLMAKDPRVIPMIELCVADTPDTGYVVSFANGIPTFNGGVHVEAARKAVLNGLLEGINGKEESSRSKSKSSANGKVKAKGMSLTMNDIKPHVSMILSCRLINPKFDAQTKNTLTSPAPKILIPDALLKPMKQWDLIDRLYAALEAKQFKTMSKTDGKKRRHVGRIRGEDANDAGTASSHECTLMVVEGNSAMGYGVKTVSLIPGGRNKIGIMPLKGKMLNTMNADKDQIHGNAEIEEFKRVMGIRDGVDYTDDTNYRTLRYGYIMLMVDSDEDGKHIMGLFLVFLHQRYPSILARGMVCYVRTPILRVYHGRQEVKFYTHREYDAWLRETPNEALWDRKYYKGLGTSTDADVKDDFKAPRIVQCFYDSECPKAFRLAFDDKLSDLRKQWIDQWRPTLDVESLQMQPISVFLEHELVLFSLANVKRSIPRFTDGLKESQRKVVWGAFLKWGQDPSKKNVKKYIKKSPKQLKVAQLAMFIAEKTQYHHGEMCLSDTIVSMAQDFVGANNLPYFVKDGQFGTRNAGGKDASNTRYSYTRPQWWLNLVYRHEDHHLLAMEMEDGEATQPVTLLPIIPMSLVNGQEGIGTAWSTSIPPHSPLDVAEWILARLNSQPLPTVLPWYNGFTGEVKINVKVPRKRYDPNAPLVGVLPSIPSTIIVQERQEEGSIVDRQGERSEGINAEQADRDDQAEEEDEELPDEEPAAVPVTGKTKISVMTIGTFTTYNGVTHVTELPIGRWMNKYRDWLNLLRENKEIKDYRDYSTDDKAHFEIYGFNSPTLKTLKLQRSFGLTNMVLLDDDDKPRLYKSTEEILEKFFLTRLPYYEARRQYIMNDLQQNIDKLNLKATFILAVVQKKIRVIGRPKREIIPIMESFGFPEELLKNVRASNFTEDEVREIVAEVQVLIDRRNEFAKISAPQLWINDIQEFTQAYRARTRQGNGAGGQNTGAEGQIATRTIKLSVRR
jgi:DNA topoisomerase-2